MKPLIPSWAVHYDEFWMSIRRRNLWFIKLRYAAASLLAALLLITELFLNIRLTSEQVLAIAIIAFSILLYNSSIHFLRKKIKLKPQHFNPIHLALMQMGLDLTALLFLTYYTGSIESPFYLFFVFHMIIGSLLLPGIIVYVIAGIVCIALISIVFLEYFIIIDHHTVNGLLAYPVFNDINYITVFLAFYCMTVFIVVLLTNNIARELYKREQDLRTTLDRLKDAEVAKQKYLMGVVHELKTPVVAIQSNLDLLLQHYLGPLDEQVEKKLKRIRIRSDDTLQAINNILRLSKLKLLNIVSSEEVYPVKILDSILQKNLAFFERKNFTAEIETKLTRDSAIQADPLLLELAFSNLVSNAVKYTVDPGKLLITVTKENNKIIFSFNDNGIGIPEYEQEKIFEEFYRASNVKGTDFEGTGLGLSVVKQIVTQHKGFIFAVSPSAIGNTEKPGTCFTVELPI